MVTVPPGLTMRPISLSICSGSSAWCNTMLANAASTAPSSRGKCVASPTTRSTFAAPRARRFFLATSSIAGALSIPTTRSTRGAIPAGGAGPGADVGDLRGFADPRDLGHLLDHTLVVVGEAQGVPVARNPLEELLHVFGAAAHL